MTPSEYLDGGGLKTEGLHKQRWAKTFMNQFHHKQNQWQHRKCSVCNEQWPVRTRLNTDPYICIQCQCDKHSPKLFSAENDMDPGYVPLCLEGMTQIEKMLIARAGPNMTVYHKHGGQRG